MTAAKAVQSLIDVSVHDVMFTLFTFLKSHCEQNKKARVDVSFYRSERQISDIILVINLLIFQVEP